MIDLSAIFALDGRIVSGINHAVHRSPPLEAFLGWALEAHVVKFVPLMMAAGWLWFEPDPRQATRRTVLCEGLLASLAALAIGRALALSLPLRLRPMTDPLLDIHVPVETALRTWSSFPSDHAVLAFALVATLWRLSPRLGLWAGLHAALLICLPRLSIGLHYPTDLLAGALVGTAVALLLARLPLLPLLTRGMVAAERARPGLFYATAFLVCFSIGEMFGSLRNLAVVLFRALRQMVG